MENDLVFYVVLGFIAVMGVALTINGVVMNESSKKFYGVGVIASCFVGLIVHFII